MPPPWPRKVRPSSTRISRPYPYEASGASAACGAVIRANDASPTMRTPPAVPRPSSSRAYAAMSPAVAAIDPSAVAVSSQVAGTSGIPGCPIRSSWRNA